MAIGRTLVLLAGVLAGAHGLQEQIKLEHEFGQASTCKAADLTTDWGTAVKYLAVTPSNRSITERDFYSMTRQFICTIDEAITKARDAAGDKIKIQQAATELSLAVTQGVLAVCSLVTFLLTIACCNAKKGPVLLSLAGLPGSGQSLHVPPVIESGPPPLPGLAADPWNQPDRHSLSPSQAASQLAHSNQIRVAHLASLQNLSAPAPAPSPAPALPLPLPSRTGTSSTPPAPCSTRCTSGSAAGTRTSPSSTRPWPLPGLTWPGAPSSTPPTTP